MHPDDRVSAIAPSTEMSPLWTLHRNLRTAVCTIDSCPTGWLLRVAVNEETLLIQRCGSSEEAFAVGDRWQLLLGEQGWTDASRLATPATAPAPVNIPQHR